MRAKPFLTAAARVFKSGNSRPSGCQGVPGERPGVGYFCLVLREPEMNMGRAFDLSTIIPSATSWPGLAKDGGGSGRILNAA